MARSSARRRLASGALTLASGTFLAAAGGIGAAGATPTALPAYYSGATHANVFGVTVNVPSALPKIPNLPNPVALGLVSVDGTAVRNTLRRGPADASRAVASLASGSLVDGANAPLAPLGLAKSVVATLADPQPSDAGSQQVALDPIANLDLRSLTARVVPATSANSSASRLASGTVAKLGQLLSLDQLKTLSAQLQQTGVATQVSGVVQQLTDLLAQVTSSTGNAQVSAVAGQLTAALNQLSAKVDAIVANAGDTAVVRLQALQATQSIAPVTDGARAKAGVVLDSLDVLGGLLSVKGFVSEATASATGRPGGAQASSTGKRPIEVVGTPVLTATLDDAGLSLSGVTGLPPAVTTQVDDLLAQLDAALNQLLGTLGVSFDYRPGTTTTSADGTKATATGAEYDVTVANTLDAAAEPLLQVGVGKGTTASVTVTQAPAPAPARVNPPRLAYTGSNYPVLGAVGLVLLLGAAALRRRTARD